MSALGAAIFWFNTAKAAVENRSAAMQLESSKLATLASQINQLDAKQEELRLRSVQLEQAVTDRSWWAHLLNDLNQQFDNDLIWLPLVEVLKDGKPITKSLWNTDEGTSSSSSPAANARPGAPAAPVYVLHVRGLYRKNNAGEQKVVYDFAAKLAKLAAFDAPEFEKQRDRYVKVDSGVDEDRFAYNFDINLPLSKPLQFQ